MINSQKRTLLKEIKLSPQAINVIEKLTKSKNPIDKRALAIFQRFVLRYDFEILVIDIQKKLNLHTKKYQSLSITDKLQYLFDNGMFSGALIDFDVPTAKKLGITMLQTPQLLPSTEYTDKIFQQTMGFVSSVHSVIYPTSDKLQESHNFFQNFAINILHEYIFLGTLDVLYRNSIGKASIKRFPMKEFSKKELKLKRALVEIDLYSWSELCLHFPPDIRKDEAIAFIESNWKFIAERKNDPYPKNNTRYKVYKKFIRDIKIFNTFIKLAHTPPNKRKAMANSISEYIESQVIDLIKKENLLNEFPLKDVNITSYTAKDIYNKLRKEIKIINNIF